VSENINGRIVAEVAALAAVAAAANGTFVVFGRFNILQII
jgi:hypothetical protein